MRHFLLFVSLTAVSAFAATAPDSVAGKVLRDNWYILSTRYETTIVFQADGRFIFLKTAFGERNLGQSSLAKVVIKSPVGDGTYTYTRTSDTDALIGLLFDDGKKDEKPLRFTSAMGGTLPSGFNYSFSLTDYVAAQSAPASNVSMRGHVAPGRPLIVGLIVPGVPAQPGFQVVPPPGARFQEVVIRVVGPSLAAFGIVDVWADPDFQLYRGGNLADVDEAHSGDWSTSTQSGSYGPGGLEKIFSYIGAFPLVASSKDAVDVVRLAPGSYTVVCNPAAGDPGGEVLIEAYFLP